MKGKHREAIFQRWRSVILRESRDLPSLDQAAARALGDEDVRDDPELQVMIRAEVEERRADFAPRQTVAVPASERAPTVAEPPQTIAPRPPAPEQVHESFDRLTRELSMHLARDEVIEAEAVLVRIDGLCDQNPGRVPPDRIEHCRAELRERRHHLERVARQVAQLERQAVEASRAGHDGDVSVVLRRLGTIHALHPRLLTAERIDAVRAAVMKAADRHEQAAAADELLHRERAVAAQVRALAESVHRFHETARRIPHEGAAYSRAEAEFHECLRRLRGFDEEWLASLVLDFADLFAEWGNHPPAAETQVDRFIASVRSSLGRIRSEVREIDGEQGQAGES